MSAIASLPRDPIVALRRAPDPVTLAKVVDELLVVARQGLAKAALPADVAAREALVEPFAADLAAYFGAMAERLLRTIRKALPIDWDPIRDVVWTVEDDELGRVVARWYAELGELAFGAVNEQLAVELRFEPGFAPAKDVLDEVGARVASINATSRQLLADAVDRAIARGTSIDDFVPELREIFAGWSETRATTIALTETAHAYNRSALNGYAASGLVDLVVVFDGPDCGWTSHADPDLAHGSERTIEDASRQVIAHPRCQRAFGAVVAR